MFGKQVRNDTVDILRSFAILAVVGSHGLIPGWVSQLISFGIGKVFWENGIYGVSMFFTISGYLITSHVIKRDGSLHEIRVFSFYRRRIARIAPPLCLLIFVAFILHVFRVVNFQPAHESLFYYAIWHAITLRYNTFYFVANEPGMYYFSPLWSLAVEEQFYLLFPLLCVLIRYRPVIILIIFCLIIYGPIYRTDIYYSFQLLGCADLLSMGCIVAIFENQWRLLISTYKIFRPILLSTGVSIIIITFLFFPFRESLQFSPSFIGIGTSFIIISSFSRSKLSIAEPAKSFTVFGRLSYEIYLFHLVVISLFPYLVVRVVHNIDYYVTLSFVLTIIFAYLVSQYYSLPLNLIIRGTQRT